MRLSLGKYKWYCRGKIHVTGFIRVGEEYLKENSITDLFSDTDSIEDFERRLASVNGQFSVVIIRDDEIWAATDRLRCFPLFYTCAGAEFVISDDCYFCLEAKDTNEINHLAKTAFLRAGYVPDNLTLINDIFQVEAGEFVTLGKSVFRKFYHDTASGPVENKDYDSWSAELHNLLHSVFSAHLHALKNRFIAIPLSGGYDSRLVAAMCSLYHPDNLFCYTYGRKGNIEALKAAEAARRLNIKWLNIEYDNELIKDYISSKTFQDYYPFASDLSGMFFMQDYFAIKYLKEKSIIPDDTVFIPGHTGDVIAGSHLVPSMGKCLTGNDIEDALFKTHFNYMRSSVSEAENIKDLIRPKIRGKNGHPWKIAGNWEMKERQAKFIVNSARAFLFFGYDYVIPFWDKAIIDFFAKLPFRLKLHKKLYDNVLKETIFSDADINLDLDRSPGPLTKRIQNIKDSIKSCLPYRVVSILTNQKSIILYDEITRYMLEDIGTENFDNPRQSNIFNSYIIQWYVFRTAGLLKRLN